jgi:hypothetical protein
MAADTARMAADTAEDQKAGRTHSFFLNKAARDAARGVPSGSLVQVISLKSGLLFVLKNALFFRRLRARPRNVRGHLRFFSSWC